MCLTIARPIPLPVGLVVENGSKTRLSISLGMPTPVSLTSTTNIPRRAVTPFGISRLPPSGMHRRRAEQIHETFLQLVALDEQWRQAVAEFLRIFIVSCFAWGTRAKGVIDDDVDGCALDRMSRDAIIHQCPR